MIAERTLAAIRADQFYVLAPEGNPWRTACHARLDAIRHERNPGPTPLLGARRLGPRTTVQPEPAERSGRAPERK